MGLHSVGLTFGRIFASEIGVGGGLIFGRAKLLGGLLSEFYGIVVSIGS